MSNNSKKIVSINTPSVQDSSIFDIDDFVKQKDLWYVNIRQHCMLFQVKCNFITYLTTQLSITRYEAEFGFNYKGFIYELYRQFGITNDDGLVCIPDSFIFIDHLERTIDFFPGRCWFEVEQEAINKKWIRIDKFSQIYL